MKIADLQNDWQALSALLDRALELPSESRAGWVASLSGDNSKHRGALAKLLGLNEPNGQEPMLINALPNFQLPERSSVDDPRVAAVGHLVGPYRLLSLLGHGGMGSVWLAERTDGQPLRRVALKLPHSGWAPELAQRLVRERDILASLEHPNIARLYDAGIDQLGRPYLALEYVDGLSIDKYCANRSLAYAQKLQLILRVAAAVSYAHTRLIVHRDLKPSNILVTASGDVRLLDFGIAKLLQASADTDATRIAGRAVTPDYSSPEQIRGDSIGTPSDVYSLAVVAYELLTGNRPYRLRDLHTANLVDAVSRLDIPPPSRVVSEPALRRQLRGDLDAIINKALKPDAAERYATVAAFADDLERHLNHQPVAARPDTLSYRLRKFITRYSLQASAAAAVTVAILAGSSAAFWQTHQARLESARAMAIKNFLLGVFEANDPRVASDKPRGEITARELLDAASTRIEKEFATQKALQIELLGLTADIYDKLSDVERYATVQNRRIELARQYYGSGHPLVIGALIAAADAACVRQDYREAERLLEHARGPLDRLGSGAGILGADWWRVKARVAGAGNLAERRHALDRALALYAEHGAKSNSYASALNMAARDRSEQGDDLQAKWLLEQALSVAQAAPDRDDSSIADLLINLARKHESLGEFIAADDVYRRAEDMARQTYGERHPDFWLALAYRARMLHLRGQRERANELFARMLTSIPSEWRANNDDQWARETYAECLAADGRVNEAIPMLESAYQAYLEKKIYDSDVREIRRKLGDAYDRAGRSAEAGTLLEAARAEYIAQEAPDSRWTLRVRERWARFLLDHAGTNDAKLQTAATELQDVIDKAGAHTWAEIARAHADLARIAAISHDLKRARAESETAVNLLSEVKGLYDLRIGPELWLVRSAVLRQSGDAAGAKQWAEKALEASFRYDDPASASIAAAQSAIGQLKAGATST